MTNLAQKMQPERREKQVVHKKVQHRIQSKVTKGEKLLFAVLVLAVILTSFLVISNYAQVYAEERKITNLQHSVNEQREYNSSLQLEVSELSSPERIMHYAKEELGMSLEDDKVKVIPGQASQ